MKKMKRAANLVKRIKGQYRQGDVLITPELEDIKACTPVPRDGGRVVLAYGEATGHAHAIMETEVDLLEAPETGRLRLVPKGPATLRHEEHGPITIPAKAPAEVVRQTEWSDAMEPRRVVD